MRSERVRRAAAKAAVTASEKTGRPVHPEVARLSRDSGTDTFVAEVQAAIVKSINTLGKNLVGDGFSVCAAHLQINLQRPDVIRLRDQLNDWLDGVSVGGDLGEAKP